MIADHRKLAAVKQEVAMRESASPNDLPPTTTLASTATVNSNAKSKIANPDQLITARVVSNRENLGELLIELPEVYHVSRGWTMVVVDAASNHHVSKVTETSGRRILLATELADHVDAVAGQSLKIGLVKQ